MNLGRLLQRASRVSANRTAVFIGDTPVATFSVLHDRAAGLAAALGLQFALRRGEHVVVFASNCAEYIECLFGCWYAGLTAVPVNARLHARELAYILQDTNAQVCFASEDLLDIVASATRIAGTSVCVVEVGSQEFLRLRSSAATAEIPDFDGDEIAWLFYTSGTTGRPKGAMLSHRNLMTMTLSYCAEVNAVSADDAIIHAAPMSHGSGLYMLPYVAGMAAQVIPPSRGFDPGETWDLVREHRQAAMFAAPTMLNRLVIYKEGHAVSQENLKSIVVGGGPLYVHDAKRAIAALGPKVTQIYGQGESPMTISVLPASVYADADHAAYEARIASVGYPQAAVEVCIADETGYSHTPGTVGEIVVKGDTVMRGYWNNPEGTAAALRDGWLHTGDLGVIDEQGFLTLKGRCKELIISGGSNIYPREVEDVLLLHKDVAEVAVIGRSHPEWGEEVVAFVVPRTGHFIDTAELDAWCLEHLARYKRPKLYRVVASLPRNAYGKVLKSALSDGLPIRRWPTEPRRGFPGGGD